MSDLNVCLVNSFFTCFIDQLFIAHRTAVSLCRLDPIILHKPISGVKQTCIAFAQDTQVYNHT